MPYFKKNNTNILFIHIPKTCGSSLEKYFSNKYDIPLNKESLYLEFDKTIVNNIIINNSLQHNTYQTLFQYKV